MKARKTPWYVKEVTSCGHTYWQVRRSIIVEGDPLATRAERRGGWYDSRIDAERLAKALNEEETQRLAKALNEEEQE